MRISRTKRSRTAVVAGLGGAAVAATALLAPPAQAFPSPSLPEAKVRLSDCKNVNGTLHSFRDQAGCRLNDAYDGTFFKNDSGGYGAKLEIHAKGRLQGKVEFHPYGEELWVYDTNIGDGDTFYVKLSYSGNPIPNRVYQTQGDGGPYKLPNIAEGKKVTVKVYDSAARETDTHGNETLLPYNLLDTVDGVA